MPVSIGRARAYARSVAKLLLLDGNSLTYRAFFALPTDMATASGQVTNAVFGFTSMLINLLRDHTARRRRRRSSTVPSPPSATTRCPSTRHNGEAAPDILRQQMGLVRQVVNTLSIAGRSTSPGYEADDLIATLATRGARPRPRRRHRHRRSRHVPARRGPARQGALQPARRVGLRAVRRGRHQGAAPASRRRSTRSTRRCAAIRPTTCPACRVSARRPRPS